jgi:hypothetical protein
MLGLTICASGPVTAAFGKYWDSGPDSSRIVIAITGDGYQMSESTQLGSDAATVANAILATSPWSTFANSINIYIIPAISSQSGADKPWLGQYVNTLLDATYGTGGAQQCLTVDYSKTTTYLSGALQKYDVVVVVVNDSMYGGSGHNAAVTSNHAAMTDIILHELGHTFANLDEEYEGNPGPYLGPEPPNPNVTTVTNPALIKWKAWIDPTTPIPTTPPLSYPNQVGLFQGAYTYSLGVYRPMLDCKMRNIGSQFCCVCKEAHVVRAHAIAPLIDSVLPGPGTMDVFEPMGFQAVGNGWQYLERTWKLDGVQISTSDHADIHPGDLAEPFSLLDLSILDNTPLVKSYPLPSAAYQWKLVPHVLPITSIGALRNVGQSFYRTSGVVSAVFVDHFYAQDANRTGAVKVMPHDGTLPTLGKTVSLCGRRETNSLNLTLSACQWAHQAGDPVPPRPLGMSNKTLGGGEQGLQHRVDGGIGTNNVGLLVTTTGRVHVTDPNGFWMTIDDGSPFRTDCEGHPGTRVYGTDMAQYANKYVAVTGICIADESHPAGPFPAAIRTRGEEDVVEVAD